MLLHISLLMTLFILNSRDILVVVIVAYPVIVINVSQVNHCLKDKAITKVLQGNLF